MNDPLAYIRAQFGTPAAHQEEWAKLCTLTARTTAIMSCRCTGLSCFLYSYALALPPNVRAYHVVGTPDRWDDRFDDYRPSNVKLAYLRDAPPSHADLVIIDTPVWLQDAQTEVGRKKAIEQLKGWIGISGRTIIGGSFYHPKDAMVWARKNSQISWCRPLIEGNGSLLWPEKWTKEKLEEQRRRVGSPLFERQYLAAYP